MCRSGIRLGSCLRLRIVVIDAPQRGKKGLRDCFNRGFLAEGVPLSFLVCFGWYFGLSNFILQSIRNVGIVRFT